MCAREAEFKIILFSICYFHAVVCERRKFGPQGWNRSYPFNTGDLYISMNVLYNYLEANAKVPWEDLRYLFGEIMYGGHITDDWDRTLCRTYLAEYLNPDMVRIHSHYMHTCSETILINSLRVSCTLLLDSQCLPTQTIRDTTTTLMRVCPQSPLTCTACIPMRKLSS